MTTPDGARSTGETSVAHLDVLTPHVNAIAALTNQRHRRSINWAATVPLFVALVLAVSVTAIAQGPAPITAKGREPVHGSFSVLPWESIDMLSGSLVLTNIDLTLPGYNGMDLQVGRVMNRGGDGPNTRWDVGVVGPTVVTLGDPVNPNPTIESWDGSVEYTFGTANSNVFMTLRYGRFTRSTRVLELPDGTICEFEHRVNDTVYRITSRTDQFGNGIEYNYDTPNVVEVTQYLGAEESAQRRRVTIDKTGTTWYVYWSYRDQAGVYHRRTTWQYQRDSGQRIYHVIPPEEPGWYYQYDPVSETSERLTVTTPEGGTVSYLSELQNCPPPPHQPLYQRFAVRERSAGGRDVPAATWTFRYDETWTSGPGSFYGWVTLPSQAGQPVTTVTYVHSRYSVGENYNLRSPLKEVTITAGDVLERRTYQWV